MTQESNDLYRIKIPYLIKFAEHFAGIEVHVLVGEKYIKLNYANENFIEILRKLQQKEVQEVYISRADCQQLLAKVSDSLSAQSFYDPNTAQEKRVENLSVAMDTVKAIINQLGVDSETVQLLKTINSRAMSLLSESPSIFAFIKAFKKNCSEEFLLSILTTYVMSLVIDKFPWRSDQVKEKGALASMMCDMILNKDDFNALREWKKNGGPLPDKIRRHPSTIADNLKLNRLIVPQETITIIEQHHEKPDGTGFPHGITAARFNQLSAIFIVSQQFTDQLHSVDYDYSKRLDIIAEIKSEYQSSKVFDKAVDALVRVVV